MYIVHHISLVILLAVLAVLWKKYDNLKKELHHKQETKESENDAKGSNQGSGENKDKSETENILSAVWCFGVLRKNLCRFQNLCYNKKEDDFIFFGNDINNSDDGKIEISTSSVADFNGHILTVTNLPSITSQNFTVDWIKEPGFIMTRFKPDNLMHVMHDDIIPLYHSLELLNVPKGNLSRFQIQLIFLDGWDPGDFKDLYEVMSVFPPIYIKDYKTGSDLLCFSNVHVGLSRTTTWYQYGYSVPQGPLPNVKLISFHIRSVVTYLSKQLVYNDSNPTNSDYIILISRKENRLILNEDELIKEIFQQTGIRVIQVGLETHSLTEVISLVRKSSGIVGMHGSLLILTAFLPMGSFLVELYPYAVKAENYTPYKTLSYIPGMNIIYKTWTNTKKENSLEHPDWPPELGGIRHLNVGEQLEILEQVEVPEHLCCDDPSWLYHIYQDTIVDVQAIVNMIHSALKEANELRISSMLNGVVSPETTFHPSGVKNISCKVKSECLNGTTGLDLSWKPPWNLMFLKFEEVNYEVLVQNANEKSHILYIVNECHFQVTKNIKCEDDYNVWVRAVLDNHIYGPMSYVLCYG